MNIVCIILSSIAVLTALAGMFRADKWAPLAAWCAYACLIVSSVKVPTWQSIAFWGAAAAIAFSINQLLPQHISRSRIGLGYIAGASLTGTFAGILLSQAGMIIGAVAGAFIGALAFSRTPRGSDIRYPFSKFINYVCAKGMPAVITACICGLSAMNIILLIQSLQ